LALFILLFCTIPKHYSYIQKFSLNCMYISDPSVNVTNMVRIFSSGSRFFSGLDWEVEWLLFWLIQHHLLLSDFDNFCSRDIFKPKSCNDGRSLKNAHMIELCSFFSTLKIPLKSSKKGLEFGCLISTSTIEQKPPFSKFSFSRERECIDFFLFRREVILRSAQVGKSF